MQSLGGRHWAWPWGVRVQKRLPSTPEWVGPRSCPDRGGSAFWDGAPLGGRVSGKTGGSREPHSVGGSRVIRVTRPGLQETVSGEGLLRVGAGLVGPHELCPLL